MRSTQDKLRPVKPVTARRAPRLARACLLALGVGALLAGCGSSDKHLGAESSKGQSAVKTRIAMDAASHHVALNELECLAVTSTKLSCLAHVRESEAAEETTATVIASFDNKTHKFSLEGPSSLAKS